LFAGLEYLDDEPSSSEADVIGPASKRQVPDSLKLTFPLMAIEHRGHYLALTWEPQADVSAVFDSPDRLFASGGHVMGLIFPGSDGKNREEGSLLPRVSKVLLANQPLVLRATLLGGVGDSVVPAVEQYVALRGLPPLPGANIDLQKYDSMAAGGWLNSKIREGQLFRHAIAGDNFKLGRAADAAVWMDWLASQSAVPALADRQRRPYLNLAAGLELRGDRPRALSRDVAHLRPRGGKRCPRTADRSASARRFRGGWFRPLPPAAGRTRLRQDSFH
jgi:hypothetical protein